MKSYLQLPNKRLYTPNTIIPRDNESIFIDDVEFIVTGRQIFYESWDGNAEPKKVLIFVRPK